MFCPIKILYFMCALSARVNSDFIFLPASSMVASIIGLNFEPWADLTEAYGYSQEDKTEKWTIDELKQLIAELKK